MISNKNKVSYSVPTCWELGLFFDLHALKKASAQDLMTSFRISTEEQAKLLIETVTRLHRKIIVVHVLFIRDELFQSHYEIKTVCGHRGPIKR